MTFKNLDDVMRFLKEKVPSLAFKKGKTSFMDESKIKPAKNYEVLQVFCDEWGFNGLIAEFWRGYNKKKPKEHIGFFDPQNNQCFRLKGDLDFIVNEIMKEIMKEKKRIEVYPKIMRALDFLSSQCKAIKNIYSSISPKDIISGADLKTWYVSCESFKCKENQICTMSIHEIDASCFMIKYCFETWNNGKYEHDSAGISIVTI